MHVPNYHALTRMTALRKSIAFSGNAVSGDIAQTGFSFSGECGPQEWVRLDRTANRRRDTVTVALMDVAAQWAVLMERQLVNGKNKNIGPIAQKTWDQTFKQLGPGICANKPVMIALLGKYWKYGDALRQWHNEEMIRGAKDYTLALVHPATRFSHPNLTEDIRRIPIK